MKNIFDYANSVRGAAHICRQEDFERLIDSPKVNNICKQIQTYPQPSRENGDDSYRKYKDSIAPLKNQLPVLLPHAHFKDGHRCNASAVPSPWVSSDFDEIDDPKAFWAEKLLPKVDELRIVLAFVSPSGKGVKVVSQRPEGMSLEEAQAWFAKEVGVEDYDHTHDLARSVYLVPRSYLLLYKPELLFGTSAFCLQANALSLLRGENQLEVENVRWKVESKEDNSTLSTRAGGEKSPKGEVRGASYDPSLHFGDMLYKDILEGFWEKKKYGKSPKEGSRHAALVAWVNAAFGLICDNDKELMLKVTPRIKPEQEIVDIIDNVEKYHTRKFSPYESRILKQVIAELQCKESNNVNQVDEALLDEEILSELPPLPPPIQILVDICPIQYKGPMIMCCLVMFGELLCRLRARLNPYEIEFPGFYYVIEASAGGGKRFINIAKDLILKVAIDNDNAQQDIYQQWEAEKLRHQNDSKYVAPPEPKPKYMLGPNKFSPSELMKEAQSNQGVGILSINEEIDTHTNLSKGGASRDTTDMERIGYDGGLFTQRYASQGTVYGSAELFLSFILTGTSIAVDRAFSDVAIENGLVSRYIFDYIDTSFKAKPVFRELTMKEKRIVSEYAEKAIQTCFDEEGNVRPIQMMNLDWSYPAIDKWAEDNLHVAKATHNLALDAFRRRPPKMAVRTMIVANWLWGNNKKNRKKVIELGLWVADHTLDSQMTRFGSYFEERANVIEQPKQQGLKDCKSTALWNSLPDVFQTEKVDELKVSVGLDSDTRKIISRLKEKKLIEKIDSNKYRKITVNG